MSSAEFYDLTQTEYERVPSLPEKTDATLEVHRSTQPTGRELSYEERRQQMKFSFCKSAVLVFQSTVGISWFTLHQPLALVGLYLGALITLLSAYVTTYGLLLLDQTAKLAEDDNLRAERIKNAEELCSLIPGRRMVVLKWLMMTASAGMIFASSISNVCMMADTIEYYYQVPTVYTKLLTFLVISIFLAVIVEPEGIEVYTYITCACLTCLGSTSSPGAVYFGKNLAIIAAGRGQTFASVPKFNLENTGEFTGNIAYAFELSSVYLSRNRRSRSSAHCGSVGEVQLANHRHAVLHWHALLRFGGFVPDGRRS